MSRTTRKRYMHTRSRETHNADNYGYWTHADMSKSDIAAEKQSDDVYYEKAKRDGFYYESSAHAGFKKACRKALRAANRRLCHSIMKSSRKCYDYADPYDWKEPYDEYYWDNTIYDDAKAYSSEFITLDLHYDKYLGEQELDEYDAHPRWWEPEYYEPFDAKPYPHHGDGKIFFWDWY